MGQVFVTAHVMSICLAVGSELRIVSFVVVSVQLDMQSGIGGGGGSGGTATGG